MKIDYVFTGKDRDKEQLNQIVESNATCVVWGMGDLANNVIRFLESHGKKVDYIYVDVESSEEKQLGKAVLRDLTDIGKECGIDIVMGHARYELADDIKNRFANIKNVYIFSNPFNKHDRDTSKEFVDANLRRFEKVYDLLEDDVSRQNLMAYINARINKDVQFIDDYSDKNYFNNSVFCVGSEEKYVDIGAYDGDTIRTFLKECDGRYAHIYAIEPDEEAYNKLNTYIKDNHIGQITTRKMGCYSHKAELSFDNSVDTSNRIIESSGGKRIPVDALDNIVDSASIIKIAQQGPVIDIVEGARHTIERNRPKLSFLVGVDIEHLLGLPVLINEMNLDYKIYFRYLGKMPSRLTMFAKQ